jgi:drug/metabolite transporter (DMT)-like permease
MTAILATIGICLFSATADYFLKRASDHPSPLVTVWFYLGFGMYACTAFGWVFVMRRLQFATLGVVYASTMVVLMAAIGVFILHETLRWQEVLGIVLAVASIFLLARFTG